MHLKRCFLGPAAFSCVSRVYQEFVRALKPFFVIASRLAQRLLRRQRLWFRKRKSRLVEQQDSLAQYVHEEITAETQLLVHIVEAVIDDADRRAQLRARRQLL